MSPESFAYWMQGFVEINNSDEPPTKEQWQIIKDHLRLVFNKVTPNYAPNNICSNEERHYCSQTPDYNWTSSIVESMKKDNLDLGQILITC